jgi:hypothetical protein
MRASRRYFPQVMDANGDWIAAGARSVSEAHAVIKMARAIATGGRYAKGRVLMTGGIASPRVVIEMVRPQ